MKLINILKDDFGNTATIVRRKILPYKGSAEREFGYVLTLTADYENDFVYFVSVYSTEKDAMNRLEQSSCNTWKQCNEWKQVGA